MRIASEELQPISERRVDAQSGPCQSCSYRPSLLFSSVVARSAMLLQHPRLTRPTYADWGVSASRHRLCLNGQGCRSVQSYPNGKSVRSSSLLESAGGFWRRADTRTLLPVAGRGHSLLESSTMK